VSWGQIVSQNTQQLKEVSTPVLLIGWLLCVVSVLAYVLTYVLAYVLAYVLPNVPANVLLMSLLM
jgi:hypothetical protein